MSLRRRQRRAMSLIEVVVALAIFAGVVGMLSQAVVMAVHAIDSLSVDRTHDQEFRFAVRQILQVPDREVMEDGGDIQTLNSGNIHWEAEIEETDMVDLFSLSLRLEWEELETENREPLVREQVFYVLRPDWSLPDERSTLLQDKTRELEDFRRGL